MPSLRTIKGRHTFCDTPRMFTVRLNFDDPNYIRTLSCLFHIVFYNFHTFLTTFFDSKNFSTSQEPTYVSVFLMNEAVM